ncbi:helitron helicase-like amino-terminal domain protein [Rhizoctonia solani AG-3 Rhs1AP]|uniref:Helitron helicase-like amino-terminal domain protein n=1 Tax=Rhizoctonia solani AG-3 Rhs1AP TaxID=1086054 RepID=A0A0A1ULA3_9AGAM|nr:helitron helicase-like amino-terminal domain protein [Rhizoctonia solani AG-3 Rhs1AP]
MPTSAQLSNDRSQGQQARAQRDRAAREQEAQAAEIQQIEQVVAPIPAPVPNPAPAPVQLTRRQLGQRRRRAREQQEREAQQPQPQPQEEVQQQVGGAQHNDMDPPNAGENINPEENQGEADAAGLEEEPVLPPNQLTEAAEARETAKNNRNRVVARLKIRGRHNLGAMSVVCPHCGAYHWIDEKKSKSTIASPTFTACCRGGKIELALPKRPPAPLWELFMGEHPLSGNFFQNIRQFNAALAFVSMGTDRVEELPAGRGPYVYKIGGSVYHRSGDLDGQPGAPRRYAQLYIYDSDHLEAAVNARTGNPINSACDPGLMRELTGVLHQHHAYSALYRQIWEVFQTNPVENVSMVIRQNRTDDRRRYNRPTTNEIALVFPDGATELQRDIVVYKRGGGIQQINTWNPAYSCLHYVLLFPFGEHGFQRVDEEEEEGGSRTTVSELQFYSYMLFPRETFKPNGPLPTADSHFSSLLRARRLLHQYIVDAWAVIDQARLIWFRMNQSTIRAELYRGVVDALQGDNVGEAPQVGQDIGTILPSSYYGGTRQMQECYQDSMAIARHLGPPQLFVTMTANPNWPEIKNELLPGQAVSDRPDLAVRVFELKRRALLNDITKNGVLGRCTAHVYTIEFQKRGLPHMHLLVWLEKASHIVTPSDVDELISAELPDRDADPLLYQTVTSTMIHGPCGPNLPNSPCWDSEKQACTKGYYPLKPWQEETVMVRDAYPAYRRRNNGCTFTKRVNGQDVEIDNRYVVPYNPYLSRRYDCHINVETCCGICAIKYIFKYVYKGHDRASIELRRRILHGPQQNNGEQQGRPDEIKIQLDSRWVSAYEGLWRIYCCRLHHEQPSIIRLQVHLEGQQMITFQADESLEDVVRNRADQDTPLTGFFKLNQHVNENTRAVANQLLYQEIPNCFSWDKNIKPGS